MCRLRVFLTDVKLSRLFAPAAPVRDLAGVGSQTGCASLYGANTDRQLAFIPIPSGSSRNDPIQPTPLVPYFRLQRLLTSQS